jgi:uncharacterized protein YcnI
MYTISSKKIKMFFQSVLLLVALWANSASGHLTMVPDFGGSSGNYFQTSIKIPHGTYEKETTKIKMYVPHGVLSVAAEDKQGWEVVTTYRDVSPYLSHGVTVSTAPDTVTWAATCSGEEAPSACENEDHAGLAADQLLIFDLQMKLGCSFGIDDLTGELTSDASIWMDEYTLWFKVEQFVSTPGTNDGNDNALGDLSAWTGTVSGSEPWGAATPLPSPFLFIYSSSSCIDSESNEVGMEFSSELIAPAENIDAVNTKAELISLIEEVQLSSQASVLGQIEIELKSVKDKAINVEATSQAALAISIAALFFSSFILGAFLGLLAWRLLKPLGFKRALITDSSSSSDTKNELV